jgi:hypothetical protein
LYQGRNIPSWAARFMKNETAGLDIICSDWWRFSVCFCSSIILRYVFSSP